MFYRFFKFSPIMNLIYLIPFISAFIGWFTNWIAIKMLFHPRLPKKILGITFHGIFPKRQKQFAEKLGKLVSNELLSFEDIEQKISNPANISKMMPLVETHIDHFLRVKLAEQMPMISMFIGDKTINQLKTVFITELTELFPVIMKNYMQNMQGELDLEKIVIDKVSGFSSDKLEQILNDIMAKEFRFVEIIGGVLGFLIGLLQVFLTILA
ncbi:MAG: YheB protein [Chitinophagaceae bacterium]|nr:MAG: YheB protein [Chitinophagaceae bacterium]